jgi:hypothetical protein
MTQLAEWKVKVRHSTYEWQGPLEAYWEVSCDPMSDNYTPDEISASDLLMLWSRKVHQEHPDGLIPIYWFAQCEREGKFAAFPFQFDHFGGKPREDFLSIFSWPLDATTGHPLNWFTVPVVDKLWNNREFSKGGFIQEATGWKPSILQPYVHLPSLLNCNPALKP